MKEFYVVVLADTQFTFENIVAICETKDELCSLTDILGKDSFYEIYRGIKYFKGMPFTYPLLFTGYIKNQEVKLFNVF